MTVRLRNLGGHVELTVKDNGHGFDTSALPPGSFGIVGMAERARIAGGTFQVESAPGRGTTITVDLPVSTDAGVAATPSSGGAGVIRVLVADDHPVVLHGLCTMLEVEDDIRVVARATDGLEAVARARETHPDIILMDVQMPNVDGIEAIRRIRADDPEAKVIVLTTYRNEDYIFPSLQAGARGYLLKDASLEELASAIRAVAAGKSLLDPALMSSHRPEYSLTSRELDVLRLMAEHCNNAQIGKRLFVSENTVKTHVSNIFAKLGCSDRAAAVLIAWKAHLI